MPEKVIISGYGEDYGWYGGRYIELLDPALIGCTIVNLAPSAAIDEPELGVDISEPTLTVEIKE